MSLSSIITEQNSTSVVLHDIACDDGVIYPDQMDTFTAIEGFPCFKGRNARTSGDSWLETPVIVDYMVVPDSDIRCVSDQDSLEVCILYLEATPLRPLWSRPST